MLNHNPYGSVGFKMQMSCLIFAPSWITGSIYITLQHIVLVFGTERSRVKPILYTWVFITCDIISLTLQAAGGGIAAGAGQNVSVRNKGTDVMMAGIVFQVCTLIVFGLLVGDYAFRTIRAWGSVDEKTVLVAQRRGFRCFAAALVVAYVAVLCRCVYRIAEMAGGWANPIMRDEAGFVVMEGL